MFTEYCLHSINTGLGSLRGTEVLECVKSAPRRRGSVVVFRYMDTWASLVAQMVKNLLAMQKTWIRSLDWEDPLEEGMATHSSILAWRIPLNRRAWQATVHGVAKSHD